MDESKLTPENWPHDEAVCPTCIEHARLLSMWVVPIGPKPMFHPESAEWAHVEWVRKRREREAKL
jgi:hypothetical protein